MPSRLLSLCSACQLVILISVTVLAKSSRPPVVNQLNGLPIAQEQHPGLPPNLFQMKQGLLSMGARTFKATAPRSEASPMTLPGFVSAVAHDSGWQIAGSVAVADVNGDGKPDLLVPTSTRLPLQHLVLRTAR